MDYKELTKLVQINFSPEMQKSITVVQNSTPKLDLGMQNEIQTIISNTSYLSPEIIAFFNSTSQNETLKSIQDIIKTLNNNVFWAQNLALLKIISSDKKNFGQLPRGISKSLNELHKETAKKILNDSDLKFDKTKRSFYSEDNTDNKASVIEANIIYSSLDLFDGISAKELMQFNNELIEYPEYAVEHPVGKKIYRIIKDWNNFIDFDKDYYYHARSLEKEQIPYSIEEMKKAPHGITSQGRFNHNGRSHYYFSDTRDGAISEIRKHGKKHCRIQVAKLKVNKGAKLFDISSRTVKNEFLNYCRYAPNYRNITNLPNEYLLPCFVASTCKKLKIDGIKYYGNKGSSNYVTWKDSYFEVVDMDIIE